MEFLSFFDIPDVEFFIGEEVNVKHSVEVGAEESLNAGALVEHLWVVSYHTVMFELDIFISAIPQLLFIFTPLHDSCLSFLDDKLEKLGSILTQVE